jgi:hypothetical protein
MEEIDSFGRKLYTIEEFCRRSVIGEFAKDGAARAPRDD